MQYRKPLPDFLQETAQVPALERLRDVGMHCGCQYTDFPLFRNLAPYSRYDHSLAVSRMVWDFTGDPAQALAGLLHDAATPVFSHVVDFLNGDHLTQESTEAGLEQIIKNDTALMAVLKKHGISPEAVSDCGQYPIADCPSPRLCADRLEYTLSNAVHYGFAAPAAVQQMYDDLTAESNEDGQPEIQFLTPDTALTFAQAALGCGRVYACDEDRYAMERLARLLKKALDAGILTDLYTRETPVVEALLASDLAEDWQAFRTLHKIRRWDVPGESRYSIPAKKRFIDPLVRDRGRVSVLFPQFREQVGQFLAQSQAHYLSGE